MIIRKMTAVFGCLDGAELELHEGVNVLKLPNEGGKSTWAAFITAMLYGLENTRAAKGRLSGRERYLPWSGKAMEGTMELELPGRHIMLQRSSENGRPFGVFRAWDLQTGLAIDSLNGENCGKVLLGVEREVFRRTAFLSSGELAVQPNADLSRRLEQLAAAGRETDSFLGADGRLRAWQNRLRYHNAGLIPKEYETLRALVDARSEEVPAAQALPDRQTLLRMLGRLELPEEPMAVPPALQGVAEEEMLPGAQRALNRKIAAAGLCFAAGLCLAAAGVFLTPWLLLGAVWAALAGVAVLLNRKLLRSYGAARLREVLPAAAACRERVKRRTEQVLLIEAVQAFAPTVQTAQEAKTAVEQALALRQKADARQQLLHSGEEEAAVRARIAELERREQAIVLARKALAEANAELQRTYVPKLTGLAGEYLQALTGGRYEALVMDEAMTLSVREKAGLLRPVSALSSGTKDQVWLALRVAMTELLLPQASPMVLDDALLTFDLVRERSAMEVLANQERQVLCFTCR